MGTYEAKSFKSSSAHLKEHHSVSGVKSRMSKSSLFIGRESNLVNYAFADS